MWAERREGNATGKRTFEDRGRERVRQDTGSDVEGLPDEEGLDEADAKDRVDLDPEDQKNATDPAYDPDEDSAG